MSGETPNWAEISSSIAAWSALALSALSLLVSIKAFKLSERAESRKEAKLNLYLENGFFRTLSERAGRAYAFLIAVNNQSDMDNSLARIELRLKYSTPSRTVLPLIVKCAPSFAPTFGIAAPLLEPPVRLDARQTVSGWCFFRVEQEILDGCTIESHEVVVTDSHGVERSLEPLILQEYSNEVLAAPRVANS